MDDFDFHFDSVARPLKPSPSVASKVNLSKDNHSNIGKASDSTTGAASSQSVNTNGKGSNSNSKGKGKTNSNSNGTSKKGSGKSKSSIDIVKNDDSKSLPENSGSKTVTITQSSKVTQGKLNDTDSTTTAVATNLKRRKINNSSNESNESDFLSWYLKHDKAVASRIHAEETDLIEIAPALKFDEHSTDKAPSLELITGKVTQKKFKPLSSSERSHSEANLESDESDERSDKSESDSEEESECQSDSDEEEVKQVQSESKDTKSAAAIAKMVDEDRDGVSSESDVDDEDSVRYDPLGNHFKQQTDKKNSNSKLTKKNDLDAGLADQAVNDSDDTKAKDLDHDDLNASDTVFKFDPVESVDSIILNPIVKSDASSEQKDKDNSTVKESQSVKKSESNKTETSKLKSKSDSDNHTATFDTLPFSDQLKIVLKNIETDNKTDGATSLTKTLAKESKEKKKLQEEQHREAQRLKKQEREKEFAERSKNLLNPNFKFDSELRKSDNNDSIDARNDPLGTSAATFSNTKFKSQIVIGGGDNDGSVFSGDRFDQLNSLVSNTNGESDSNSNNLLDSRLLKQLQFLNFSTMTKIQKEAVPIALKTPNRDMLIKAPTGSGKTLAFLVPMINRILKAAEEYQKKKEGVKNPDSKSSSASFPRDSGVLAVILSPTKELANQSSQVAEKLCRMIPWLVVGSLSGGENPKSEKSRIRKGLHIVFATPGRMNYHLEFTSAWKVNREYFQCFVLDEADRLLDLGFEKQVKMIFNHVVKWGNELYEMQGKVKMNFNQSQTMLVSATLTSGVQKLADFCLKEDRVKVGFLNSNTEYDSEEMAVEWAIPSTLQQYSLICPTKSRLPCLISVILQNAGKIVVFFSSCASVDFHYDLFTALTWPLAPEEIQEGKNSNQQSDGKMKQYKGGFIGLKENSDGEESDSLDDDLESEDGATASDGDDGTNNKSKLGKNGNNIQSSSANPKSKLAKTSQTSKSKESTSSTDSDQSRIFHDISIHKLHGNLSSEERQGHLKDFMKPNNQKAVLFTSDVMSRGIDLPLIDWIVQYDPPAQVEEYLHRIGRTARCGNAGKSLLFLQPSEEKYLILLKEKMRYSESSEVEGASSNSKDPVTAMNYEKTKQQLRMHLPKHSLLLKIRDLAGYMGTQMTRFVSGTLNSNQNQNQGQNGSNQNLTHVNPNHALLHAGRKAFLAWMKSYSTFPRQLKTIFNVRVLHPGHVASTFCLSEAPRRIAQGYRADMEEHNTKKQHPGAFHNLKSNGKSKLNFKQSSGSKSKLRLSDRLAATTANYVGPKVRKNMNSEKSNKSNQNQNQSKTTKVSAGDSLRANRNDTLFVRKEKATKKSVEKSRLKEHSSNMEFM